MSVKIIAVAPAYLHKVNIQWELDAASIGAGSHTFEVERSGSPRGPWETITPLPLTDIFTFQDPQAQLFDMDRDIYYRVKASSGGPSFYSEPHAMVGDFDRRRWLLWRKMNYDEEIMLAKGNGVPLKIYKKKHYGTRCPVCYDTSTGMITLSKCTNCLGTGWVTGYYPSIETYGHLKPNSVRTSDNNPASIVNYDTVNGFLLNFPIVRRDDIIVEARTNVRWRVESVQSTELIRTTVHQDIVLVRIPISEIEYSMEF